MKIQFDKIKLIIWDLDDTFWKGTLSEGEITPVEENVRLIKTLTDRGVINMVCSKNDEGPATKRLEELGINDLFVFNSINWLPKGQRIAERIKEMGLRPVNCLFIDDNIQNLKEAEFHAEGLMTTLPESVHDIIEYFEAIPSSDLKHKRLQQYKVLEEKSKAAARFSDNTEFLYSSNIRVDINYDCHGQEERLAEMVLRTNQLNFTKQRDTFEQVKELIDDPKCTTGYVSVKDNFGDYGITGFFAIKDNTCIHFLFSCRTIGQGVEQYVYSKLGYPILKTIGPVIGEVDKNPAPGWINQEIKNGVPQTNTKDENIKILCKGACDLGQMCSYLDSQDILTEFTYIGKRRHNHIEFHNHSVNILGFQTLNNDARKDLVDELLFADDEMFDTAMFEPHVRLVVMSTMIESNLGVYKRKSDGYQIAALESLYPLTDKQNWPKYINHEIFDAQNNFTEEWLEKFSNEWDYCGPLTPDDILENIKQIISLLPASTKICYILGPELEYEAETKPQYIGRHKLYAAINALLRQFAVQEPRLLLLDTNLWVKSQSDFTNNINHWQRKVYYKLAGDLNHIIADNFNYSSKRKSHLYLFITDIKYRMVRAGFLETKLWKLFKSVFR